MHPALSVIFFTTLSGAGYGLLALLGAGVALGWWPPSTQAVLFPLGIGLALATIGLLASVSHLGQPWRAWRAFSQWRSSWLSREGVASLLTYLPALGLGALALAAPELSEWSRAIRLCGALLALCAGLTVFCTARIYSSLRTIPAWHNAYVTPGYLLLALYSGSLWLWALGAMQQRNEPLDWSSLGLPPWLLIGTVAAAMLATMLKLFYWRRVDHGAPTASIGSATGLDRYGAVSAFERPHTEANYLTREMGFVLARKHSASLRVIALIAGFGLPMLLISVAIAWLALSPLCAVLALGLGSLGVFAERWLFFAEARHVVTLYYGAAAV